MPQTVRLTLWLMMALPLAVFGQAAEEYALPLTTEIDRTNKEITISWPKDETANSFIVYRKHPLSTSWNVLTVLLPNEDTFYTDANIQLNKTYEYRVSKNMTGYSAQGYLAISIDGSIPLNQGGIILVMDTSVTNQLAAQVNELTWDLRGDGFQVFKVETNPTQPVEDVKASINSIYNQHENVQYVYLLGSVPVPYSGEIAPDGHNDHVGAWPADVYYGVISNLWTDNAVNITAASRPANHNKPGDGKFDQSLLPANADLGVGRVDLSDLPNFNRSEANLLKNYLEKAHQFKLGQIKLPKRGLIDDNFGGFSGEAFAANGWRNFSSLLGASNITEGKYLEVLDSTGYLWSYGCGPGTYTRASGVANSAQIASDSLLTAFTMLFGSYFGDWDVTNNFLRTPLAQGLTLTNCWAGRPNWYFHHMAQGWPIGYATRLSQNNDNTYTPNYGARFVHVALMGDPSLRMDYPETVANFMIQSTEAEAALQWNLDPSARGYAIFRSQDRNGPYQQIRQTTINSFTDTCHQDTGWYYYMVRPYRLDTTNSGTIYNYGIGQFDSAYIETTDSLYFDPAFVVQDSSVNFSGKTNATSLQWRLEDSVTITQDSFEYTFFGYPLYAEVAVEVIASNDCLTDTFEYSITINMPAFGLSKNPLKDLSLYPNPAHEVLFLDQSAINVPGAIEVIGADGKVWKRLPPSTVTRRQININSLPPGAYFIRYIPENGTTQMAPFVKQ